MGGRGGGAIGSVKSNVSRSFFWLHQVMTLPPPQKKEKEKMLAPPGQIPENAHAAAYLVIQSEWCGLTNNQISSNSLNPLLSTFLVMIIICTIRLLIMRQLIYQYDEDDFQFKLLISTKFSNNQDVIYIVIIPNSCVLNIYTYVR